MNSTELRKNIFHVLDEVLDSGKPAVINRKNRVLKIVAEKPTSKVEKLRQKEKQSCFVGNSDDIITIDWAKEWKPDFT